MKRKRVKHITRLHIILFFLVIIIILSIFISIKHIKNKKLAKYKEYETEIERVSKVYYKINNLEILVGHEKRIDISKLEKQGLLNEDITEECKGYVIIRNDEDELEEKQEITYNAYIKCGNKYRTVNYSEY